jgi:hypothetical protein
LELIYNGPAAALAAVFARIEAERSVQECKVTTVSDEDRSQLQGQVVHVDQLNSPEAIERLTTSSWQRCGFYANRTSSGDGRSQISVFIPHWSIVIPLTLLAAVRIPAPSF